MMRPLFAAAAAAALTATPVAAQMAGNPVYYSPKHGTGLSINADYGRGLNDASSKTNYFGGRAVLGLPIVTLSAGVGVVKADENLIAGAESEVVFGGTASVSVLSAPLLPIAVAVQGGLGYLSQDVGNTISVPIGLAVAIKPPTPGLNVEIWGAPRIQISRFSPDVGDSSTETDFGASAGVNLGLPTGLGLHAAIDWVNQDPDGPIVVGIGAHYKFTIPGLGIVGM